MSIKVWPIEGRRQDVNNTINLKELYVTGQALGANKRALDSISYGAYTVAQDAAEVLSTDSMIVATGHLAKRGDLIKILTSAGSIEELEIGVASVTANNIYLTGRVSTNFQVGDTFAILRYTTLSLSSSGACNFVNSFIKDGASVTVTEDTVTPANNIAFPVKLMDFTGDISVTAHNLNVQLQHDGANPDSVKIGDGTTIWGITAGTQEGKVIDSGAITQLTAISGKLPAALGQQTMAASLSVTLASNQSTLPISAASLPLPTGAATETTLASVNTGLSTLNTNVATQTTLASIDTKVATQTTLSAMSAKLPASLGIKADSASLSVSLGTETRALIDNLEAYNLIVSNCVTANILAVKLSDLNGAATEVTLAAASAKLPATLGQKSAAASLAVVQATETVVKFGLLDFTSTSVTDAGYTQLTSTIGATAGNKIWIMVQGGEPMYLAIGAAASEVNALIIPPGGYNGPIGLSIPASSRLSLKAVNASTTINTGKIFYNIVG